MRIRRFIADLALKQLGLARLSNSRLQKGVRAVLDEIDFQQLRDGHPCAGFSKRSAMFQFIQSTVIKGEAIEYLEFGVHRGDSIREWITLNECPESRFYGFDSFEGLPEDWRNGQGRGHFDMEGNIPKLEDARVAFVKGWFDQTVPRFVREFAPKSRLVLHMDADLYGSTMIPLMYFTPYLKKGSLLLFDEFYDREHEFKALQDYVKISRVGYRAVAQMDNYGKFCIELE